jgi:hypothetical protein
VENEHDCQTNTGTDNERHGDKTDQGNNHSREAPPGTGITHSISPGTPYPETVLVAAMTDGSYSTC